MYGLVTVLNNIFYFLNYFYRCGFVGSIHTNRDEYYELFRQVENQACNILFPLVIIRPVSTQDVAIGVKVAREMGIELSVRSGGHGHNCNSLKNASLHFDLRRLNQIQLQRSEYVSVRFLIFECKCCTNQSTNSTFTQ